MQQFGPVVDIITDQEAENYLPASTIKTEYMKKILPGLCIIILLGGCFIFQRKDKYGCPTDGRNVGAEKIAAGDPKAIKASSKAKYKGGRQHY